MQVSVEFLLDVFEITVNTGDTLQPLCFPLPHSHNKIAGKELQKQLSQRVLNEDLRAFLELIQNRGSGWKVRAKLDRQGQTVKPTLYSKFLNLSSEQKQIS